MRVKHLPSVFRRFTLILMIVCMAAVAGCQSSQENPSTGNSQDGFTAGTDDTFGILKDGDETFAIHTENGEISTIDVTEANTEESATLILPTDDDSTIAIMTADGGGLAFTYSADGVLVSVSDPDLGEFAFSVPTLPFMSSFARRHNSMNEDCSDKTEFLDGICEATSLLDVDQIVALVLAELDASDSSLTVSEQFIRELLDKYLGPLLSFCESWSDFREKDNPCNS